MPEAELEAGISRVGLQHLAHFWGRLQAHLLCPLPALQPSDPCRGVKKTVGPHRRQCVEGRVGTSTLPSPGTAPERVRQGLGSCQRHVGDWVQNVSLGPERVLTCAGPILPGQVKLPQQLQLCFLHAQGLGLFPCNDKLLLRPARACAIQGWSPAPHLTAVLLLPSPRHPSAAAFCCQA